MGKDYTHLRPGTGGSQARKRNRTPKTKGTLWAEARRCDGSKAVRVRRTGSLCGPPGGADSVGWRGQRGWFGEAA